MLTLNFTQIKNSNEPLTHIECELELTEEFIKRSHGLVYQVDNVIVSGDAF